MRPSVHKTSANRQAVRDGSQVYTYDGWNRLISVSHGYRDSSGNLQHGQAAATMSYDSKGRRISKAVIDTGSWDCTYNYYYNGNQQIEQRNGSNQTIRQNVWGLQYIDELIQTSLNSSPTSQSTCDTPYWALQDANWNVLGIVDSNGVLKERYEYSPYGQRTVYFSPGSNDPFCTAPTVGSQRFVASGSVTEPWGLCEFGHQGLMHDEECGLVYNRARYLSPGLGRYAQRDPLNMRALGAIIFGKNFDYTTFIMQANAGLLSPAITERSIGEWTRESRQDQVMLAEAAQVIMFRNRAMGQNRLPLKSILQLVHDRSTVADGTYLSDITLANSEGNYGSYALESDNSINRNDPSGLAVSGTFPYACQSVGACFGSCSCRSGTNSNWGIMWYQFYGQIAAEECCEYSCVCADFGHQAQPGAMRRCMQTALSGGSFGNSTCNCW